MAGSEESGNLGNWLLNTGFMFLLDLFQGVDEAAEIVCTFLYILLYIVKYGEARLEEGRWKNCENPSEYIYFFWGGGEGGLGRWEEGGGGGPKHPGVLFQYLQVFTYLHNISASFSPYIVGRVVQCIIILLIG